MNYFCAGIGFHFIMAKIRNQSIQAKKTRERVRKCRKKKKSKKLHEERVAQMIANASKSNFNDSDTSQTSSNGTFGVNNSDILNENLNRDDSVDISYDMKEKLRIWAVKHRISHLAIGHLLSILKCAGFSYLPKDARTLMQTPTTVQIASLQSGKLWYQGIRKCLEHVLNKCNKSIEITLDFNFDGLPLFNSSKLQFWPILSSIQGALFSSLWNK